MASLEAAPNLTIFYDWSFEQNNFFLSFFSWESRKDERLRKQVLIMSAMNKKRQQTLIRVILKVIKPEVN